MWQGSVMSIHVAPAASAPMITLAEVRAFPGRGLDGDRYALGTGHYSARPSVGGREVTLIEIEAGEALGLRTGNAPRARPGSKLTPAPTPAITAPRESAMSQSSEFRKQLEAAVNARHSRMNPFTEKWVKGELTRPQLGAWAAQHYQYVSQFPRWCAAVYAECPYPDARDFLLENIVEEESGVKHVDLLIRFAEACGVSRGEVERTVQLPTTRALTAW